MNKIYLVLSVYTTNYDSENTTIIGLSDNEIEKDKLIQISMGNKLSWEPIENKTNYGYIGSCIEAYVCEETRIEVHYVPLNQVIGI